MRTILALVAVMTVALAAAGAAGAAPKVGCPVGEGWEEMTVADVASEVFPNLLPGVYPWQSQGEFAEFVDAVYDRNDDGSICLKTQWGDDLNPNSKWYLLGIDLGFGTGVTQYHPRDNTANASNNA